MQDTLNSKKQGDMAFRAKAFGTAIDNYTQVFFISAHTIYDTKSLEVVQHIDLVKYFNHVCMYGLWLRFLTRTPILYKYLTKP